jgi:hypothetical protein
MVVCVLNSRPALAAHHPGATRVEQPIGAPLNLGDALFGPHDDADDRKPPPVARYAPDGGDDFILDRSVDPPLLRFDDSQEIWVLQAQPGPRGDIIYRNDVGEPVLRATRLGGLTVFTPDHPDGAAAALAGEARAIRPAPVPSPGALLQRLAQASARCSHAVQRLVVFDAPDVTPDSAPLIADAATIVSDAIGELVRRSVTARGLTKLLKVQLLPGRKPAASMKDAVLQVVVAPRLGVAGRPSSRRISIALTR